MLQPLSEYLFTGLFALAVGLGGDLLRGLYQFPPLCSSAAAFCCAFPAILLPMARKQSQKPRICSKWSPWSAGCGSCGCRWSAIAHIGLRTTRLTVSRACTAAGGAKACVEGVVRNKELTISLKISSLTTVSSIHLVIRQTGLPVISKTVRASMYNVSS